MDIGRTQRRFVAEPAQSPVPGEEALVQEPAAEERAEPAGVPARSDDAAAPAGRQG